MKKKFILLPMFLLVLAACGKTSSSETPTSSAPGTSVPGTSEVTTSEDPITSAVEESSDDLPPPPPSTSVQESVLTTIEEARKVADGTEVTVEGVITAIYGMANDSHGVIIQEGDYAITLPFVDKAITAELEVGNVIQAKGKRKLFNGLVQLSNSAITFKAAEGPEIVPLTLTEADWTIENLQTKDARWVKVEGLKHVSGSVDVNDNSPITVKLGNTELPIYMSQYIDMAEKEAIKTKIESLKSTDTITFVGPVGFYKTPQLNPVNAATITIVEGEGPVGPVLPTSLTFTPATAELAPGETFATTLVKAPSDATLEGLTYTSADEAVATVSETGVITAVDVGTTTITAQVGEVKATFVVNVTIPTSEKLWGIDFKVPANWVRDDKEGQYYSYNTPYNVTLKDGDVEMDWILRGANPNNLVSEGVRFGGKEANAKLGEVIADGLPMGEELAAELAATYAQSKAPIVGEVSEVMINIGGDFGAANFTREKVYLQASVDADFTNPIDLGSKDAVNGKLVFDLETALEDHYFRVIFGMKLTTDKNGGLLVHEMVFSKALETEIPDAPKAKVAIDNLYTGKALDTVLDLEEAYVIWHNAGGSVLVLGTQEGTALVSYYNADSTLKATFAGLNKGEYVNMSVKLANNGTGGDFARAVIGIPQVVGGVLYSKVTLPSWQFDGMEEATIVKNIAEDGLNWLADATTDFLGTYVKVTATVAKVDGDQIYLEYESAVAGKNTFENGTNYIRLSAYKAAQLGFTLEANKTYTIEGIIGGVNKDLPLSGTDNPIFRLYVQTLTEVVA